MKFLFSAQQPSSIKNSLMSKKKDQDKFNEYAINTDDAWEIDDRKMTLKILDNDEDDDLGISKQVEKVFLLII
jgi:hypothetical protein